MTRKEILWHTVLAALPRAVPPLVGVVIGLLLGGGLLPHEVEVALEQALREQCELRWSPLRPPPSLAPTLSE